MKSIYSSDIGDLIIFADLKIDGIYFANQKNLPKEMCKNEKNFENKIIRECKIWLDDYFNGIIPENKLEINFTCSRLQKKVYEKTLEIPFGETLSYKSLSLNVFNDVNHSRFVANTLAKNKFIIVVPCHRVISSKGELRGYLAGVNKKRFLLEHERKFR
ncbi:MAG: methylated-DNA--[protein]-cysteine S-methyltransferase [Peptoniphilaceae bacterium]|nr:methylated-DNA--[protein]-cysteine S-methyltransferase [Peptoniphilaceae bacterium]MDD7382756.1 methylated-DNA--[protein]-cysteine S-methyltransferase [Peptoniphilaceae bacterium]MDY3737912.1 methylated-DNA--[protein]-cysteine S-methyltransferase [Peptoniphilaceae bacterium]